MAQKIRRAPRNYCVLKDRFSEGAGIIHKIFLQIMKGSGEDERVTARKFKRIISYSEASSPRGRG